MTWGSKEVKRPLILVVDDEEDILQILEIGLNNKGFDVLTAMNSQEAIKISLGEQIQYALLDIRLPDSNGIELSVEIKKNNPGVVIILMTGYPGIKSVIKALRYHVYDYLIKPFRIEQLISVIERAKRENRLIGENNYNAEIIRDLKRENEQLKETLNELIHNKNRVGVKSLKKYQALQTDQELAVHFYTKQQVNKSDRSQD